MLAKYGRYYCQRTLADKVFIVCQRLRYKPLRLLGHKTNYNVIGACKASEYTVQVLC